MTKQSSFGENSVIPVIVFEKSERKLFGKKSPFWRTTHVNVRSFHLNPPPDSNQEGNGKSKFNLTKNFQSSIENKLGRIEKIID